MKAKYGGPMTVDDLYQAIWQDREFFRSHAITHVNGVFLYFTPCDQYGQPVTVRDQASGDAVDGFMSAGAYHPAADAYDHGDLEPKPVVREKTKIPAGLPKAPFASF